MDKLTIYITTYKDFEPIVKSPVYKVLDARDYRNSDDVLDDRFFSELFMYSKVNVDSEYVGFCHYRKYFEFLDAIPDVDKIFQSYDAIALKPMGLRRNVRDHYGLVHNGDDLKIVESIIKRDYPEYIDDFNAVMNGNTFFACNIFIMRRDDFYKYREFVMGVLNKYVQEVGTDILARIEANKDKYIKKFYPNNTEEYQYRIGGYLAERLTNVFFCKWFRKVKTFGMVLTEGKYGYKGI